MIIKFLGLAPYLKTLEAMQAFTRSRSFDHGDNNKEKEDEIWILEHPPVFTLGKHADPSHILKTHPDIPVIKTDRGGQITYHGPGQLIIYFLLNLKQSHFFKNSPKKLVCHIENTLINLLAEYKISAEKKPNAPGVYINNKKIASLGLRIINGYCYHGLSFNINMDLSPFLLINPCGYENLEITQLSEQINIHPDLDLKNLNILNIGEKYIQLFLQKLT